MGAQLNCLQNRLNNELKPHPLSSVKDCPPGPQVYTSDSRFLSPWAYERESWTIGDIIIGKSKGENWRKALIKARKSTWFYRRVLPLILLIVWVLLACTIFGTAAIVIVVIFVAMTIILFLSIKVAILDLNIPILLFDLARNSSMIHFMNMREVS